MFKAKIDISGMAVKNLLKILSKFSRKYAVRYEIKNTENGVLLNVDISSNKALNELERRLKIAKTKSGRRQQIKIDVIEIRGGTV